MSGKQSDAPDDDTVWVAGAAKGILIALAHTEGQTTVRITSAVVTALIDVISGLAERYPKEGEAFSRRAADLILQAGRRGSLATTKVAGNG